MLFSLLTILFYHAFFFFLLLKKSYCRTYDTLRIPNNKVKAKSKTHPIIAETKIRDFLCRNRTAISISTVSLVPVLFVHFNLNTNYLKSVTLSSGSSFQYCHNLPDVSE